MTDTNSDDSFSDEDSPINRKDMLTRRPSYRKILNDLSGGEIVQLATLTQSGETSALHTITTSGDTVVQYTQGPDGHIFVPGNFQYAPIIFFMRSKKNLINTNS